jgi:hypothetical protein
MKTVTDIFEKPATFTDVPPQLAGAPTTPSTDLKTPVTQPETGVSPTVSEPIDATKAGVGAKPQPTKLLPIPPPKEYNNHNDNRVFSRSTEW